MSTKLLLSLALVVCSITFGITGCQKPEEAAPVKGPSADQMMPGGTPQTAPAKAETTETTATAPVATPAAPAAGTSVTTTTAQ